MGATATEEDDLIDVLPPVAHEQVLPEMQITAPSPDRDLEETDWLADILRTAAPLVTPGLASSDSLGDAADAAGRVGRRVVRFGRSAVADPAAAALGAGQGATLGWLDEIMGGAQLAPSGLIAEGVRSQIQGDDFDPAARAAEARDLVRGAARDAESRSPAAYHGAEVAGSLAPMVIPGPAEAEGAGFLARTGRGALTGAEIGALASAGESEASDLPTLAEDMAPGIVTGGLAGGAIGALHGGAEAGVRQLEAMGRGADDALLAAIGGERQLSPARLRDWGRTPEQRATSARRLREADLVGPFSTPETIRDRAAQAAEQSYAESQGIRQRFDEEGGLVPLDEIVAALRGQSEELARDPVMRGHGLPQRVSQMADEWAAQPQYADLPVIPAERIPLAHRPGLPIREFEDPLSTLGQSLRWPTGDRTPIPEEIGQESYRLLRDVGDTAVGRTLGPEEAARFEESRLRTQALQRARIQAQAAMDRRAGARSGGLTELLAGNAGATIGAAAGPLGAAAGAMLGRAASRSARPTELARRAWLADMADRMTRGTQIPEALARWAPILERAAARGSLEAVDAILSRRDPEYAQASSEVISAVRPLEGDSGTPEIPFDPSELEGPEEVPFDPSELE